MSSPRGIFKKNHEVVLSIIQFRVALPAIAGNSDGDFRKIIVIPVRIIQRLTSFLSGNELCLEPLHRSLFKSSLAGVFSYPYIGYHFAAQFNITLYLFVPCIFNSHFDFHRQE